MYIQTKERKFAIITKYSFCSFDFYLRSVFSCFLTIVTVSKTFAVKENFFPQWIQAKNLCLYYIVFEMFELSTTYSFSHLENKTITCCVPIVSFPIRSLLPRLIPVWNRRRIVVILFWSNNYWLFGKNII